MQAALRSGGETRGGAPCVMIVDDSPFLVGLLKRIFSEMDWRVEYAASAQETRVKLERIRPNLVLMDINLPDGTGDGLCDEIRGDPRLRDTVVILMSGLPESMMAARVEEHGADGYIKKPFSPASLTRWIRDHEDLLRGRGRSSGALHSSATERTGRREEELRAAGHRFPESPTIVVTDDSPTTRKILASILGSLGAEVHTFGTMEEAAYFLRDHKAHVILLDVTLPDIEGHKACSILKEYDSTRHARIYLMSGRSSEELEELRRRAGADGFLTKPFTVAHLLSWIERHLPGLAVHPAPADTEGAATSPSRSGERKESPETPPIPAEAFPLRQEEILSEAETDILLQQLRNGTKDLRLDACYTLGEYRVVAAIGDLQELLKHEDEEIAAEAAIALGRIGHVEVLDKLLDLLEHGHPWIKERAAEAIGALKQQDAIDSLLSTARRGSFDLKVAAIKAIHLTGGEKARNALMELASSQQDPETAEVARWYLENTEGTG